MAADAAGQSGDAHAIAITGKTTFYGLVLFAIYVVIYSVFVGLNTFWPQIMAKPVLYGVNLAVVYGLGLIIAAFVLAIIYAVLCNIAESGKPRTEANREV